MKQRNAMHTVAAAMHEVCQALKPALRDLASTQDDWQLEQVMRFYLSAATQGRKASRLAAQDAQSEYVQ